MFSGYIEKDPLREKCPNTELFLVRILPHSDWIRRDTSYLSVFSPNAGKYRPEITPYFETFHAYLSVFSLNVGKHGPEITPYLDTFHAVTSPMKWVKNYLVTYVLNHLSNWRLKLKWKIETITNNTNYLSNLIDYK